MSAEKKVILTAEGIENLEKELTNLKVVRRKEVAEKIKEARGQGDLSENAEYDSAKEEQAEIEARIVTIEKMLRNAEVIDESDISADSIHLGSKIRVLDIEFNDEVEYKIVGPSEADPSAGRISNESPLGIALLGKGAGDTVEVPAPDGNIQYKVLAILV